MDVQDAVSALQSVGIDSTHVTPVVGGWSFWTFEVDARFIARFPRDGEIAAAARRELALLPALAKEVSFLVPHPSHSGIWLDWPFIVYPCIPGRALTRSDGSPELLEALRGMLAQLHGFSAERASELLDIGGPQDAWRKRFEDLWPVVEDTALPAIDVSMADRVRREFERFLNTPFEFPHCLVHNDLGPEHVLIDETTEVPTGLIDFESAWVGDPAVDFVPLRALFDAEALDVLLGGRDLGGRLAERMKFYRWMGSVHAIIYGVKQDSQEELTAGISELRRRLDAHPF